MGAEGRLSSISVRFSDLFVPSLLSNRQLASRLDVWFWVSPALGSDVPLGNHFDWGIMFSLVSNRSMWRSGPYVLSEFDPLCCFVLENSEEL